MLVFNSVEAQKKQKVKKEITTQNAYSESTSSILEILNKDIKEGMNIVFENYVHTKSFPSINEAYEIIKLSKDSLEIFKRQSWNFQKNAIDLVSIFSDINNYNLKFAVKDSLLSVNCPVKIFNYKDSKLSYARNIYSVEVLNSYKLNYIQWQNKYVVENIIPIIKILSNVTFPDEIKYCGFTMIYGSKDLTIQGTAITNYESITVIIPIGLLEQLHNGDITINELVSKSLFFSMENENSANIRFQPVFLILLNEYWIRR
jgi:hypothetical protein